MESAGRQRPNGALETGGAVLQRYVPDSGLGEQVLALLSSEGPRRVERHSDDENVLIVDGHPRAPVPCRVVTVRPGHGVEGHQVLADAPVAFAVGCFASGADADPVIGFHHLETGVGVVVPDGIHPCPWGQWVQTEPRVHEGDVALVEIPFHPLYPVRVLHPLGRDDVVLRQIQPL